MEKERKRNMIARRNNLWEKMRQIPKLKKNSSMKYNHKVSIIIDRK